MTPGQSPQGQLSHGVPKPERTFIRVDASPQQFEVDVPMRPTKRALIVAAATGIIFVITYIAGSIIWLIPTVAVFAWGLSLVFRTHRLIILPETGYELSVNIFGYDQTKRGPMASVVRFDARGRDEDDDTVLKIVTHEGEFVIANAFTEAENRWVAAEGNAWLQRLRAQNPNPVG